MEMNDAYGDDAELCAPDLRHKTGCPQYKYIKRELDFFI